MKVRKLSAIVLLGLLAVGLVLLGFLPVWRPSGVQSGSSLDQWPKLFEAGRLRLREKEFDGAISAFSDAARIEPQNPQSYYWRGHAYRQKGDPDKGIVDCTEAIRLDPKFVDAYEEGGHAYVDKGELGKAIADYTAAINTHGGAVSYYFRGNAYRMNGDHEQAIADCTEAVRIRPEFGLGILLARSAVRDTRRFGQGDRGLLRGHSARTELRVGLRGSRPCLQEAR